MEQTTLDNLNDLRQRVLSGEKFSVDEYREIMKAYRAVRQVAVSKAAPKIDILSRIQQGTKG